MSFIKKRLQEFFERFQSLQPEIDYGENGQSSTSPVSSPFIDRLIPEEAGAIHVIHGANLSNTFARPHVHQTLIYKRQTPEGSLYCLDVLDDERYIGNKLKQYCYVLNGLGLSLGGCEILPLEKELYKLKTTEGNNNSIYIKRSPTESLLLIISNNIVKFENNHVIGRWLKPDFSTDIIGDRNIDFKQNGDPVITVTKTLDGHDFTQISPPDLLLAIGDSLASSSLRLNRNYEEYIAREKARLSL